jgi:hypothetical protein
MQGILDKTPILVGLDQSRISQYAQVVRDQDKLVVELRDQIPDVLGSRKQTGNDSQSLRFGQRLETPSAQLKIFRFFHESLAIP